MAHSPPASLELRAERRETRVQRSLSVAYLPDGASFVTGEMHGTIRVWGSASLELRTERRGDAGNDIYAIAVSPDGASIVSGSKDKAIRLWDSASLQLLAERRDAHKQMVSFVGFRSNSILSSSYKEGAICEWDSASLQPTIAPFNAITSRGRDASYIHCMALSTDGFSLAYGTNDGTVLHLYDSALPEQPWGAAKAANSLNNTYTIAFSPDGTSFVSGNGPALKLWVSVSCEEWTTRERAHTLSIDFAAFSPDGSVIVSASGHNKTIRVWDPVALELRAETCNAYDDHPIKCVALSPHGCSIVSSSSLGTIRVWGSVSDLSPSVAEHEPDVMLGTSWSQTQVPLLSNEPEGEGARRGADEAEAVHQVERVGMRAAAAGDLRIAERLEAIEREIAQVREQLLETREELLAARELRARQSSVVVLFSTELTLATSDFNASEKIGEGGFGAVYRAQRLPSLPSTGPVAVKRLAVSGLQGQSELQAEIQLLGTCRHENLLPLLGICLDLACLVYPLMRGGSLEDRLMLTPDARARLNILQIDMPTHLSWQMRLRAIRDATRALLYLHTPSGPKGVILHRDVKPANILLDLQGNAKLSDCGLAREVPLLRSGHPHVSTRSFTGTPGFIDPLYTETGRVSQLTDGFAMGVSLLMCLAACPAVEVYNRCGPALENLDNAPGITDRTAGWPDDLVKALLQIAGGLMWRRLASQRMPLEQALAELERISDQYGLLAGMVDAQEEVEARICVVCMSAPRTVRFGCGHAVCCQANGCAAAIQQRGICPHCRAPIRLVDDIGDHIAFQATYVMRQG